MHDSDNLPSTLPSARRDVIAARLRAGRGVNAQALASEFGLSEDAIRRDLRALAQQGLCRRVYGGALPLSPAVSPLATRNTRDLALKRQLARAAAALIQPGMTLFLDTGSTVQALAAVLPQGLSLTVVTNAPGTAALLAPRDDLTLHMIGGQVDRITGGCTDARALADIARFRFDLAFLGACALSRDDGLGGFDAGDVDCKRAALDRSRRAALMLAADKVDTFAPHQIAPLSAISDYVLDPAAPADLAPLLSATGARVTLAEPDPNQDNIQDQDPS